MIKSWDAGMSLEFYYHFPMFGCISFKGFIKVAINVYAFIWCLISQGPGTGTNTIKVNNARGLKGMSCISQQNAFYGMVVSPDVGNNNT